MEVEQPANTCYPIYLASYTPSLPFLYMYVCILHNQKISELHILKFGGLEVRNDVQSVKVLPNGFQIYWLPISSFVVYIFLFCDSIFTHMLSPSLCPVENPSSDI